MNFSLNRYPPLIDSTFGSLYAPDGAHICLTLELPWRNNEQLTSCIPTGIYDVIPHNSTAHPNTWEITNVPGRSEILIHNGNTYRDSKGCILVGDQRGVIDGYPAVLNSDKTLKMLRATLPKVFTLTII